MRAPVPADAPAARALGSRSRALGKRRGKSTPESGEPRWNLDWRDPETYKRLVETARKDCPWPPHPATWHSLDGHCGAALNRFYLTDDWRGVLADPLGDRYAVVAALDEPQCRPHGSNPRETSWWDWPRWRGEPRPDLRERCAADAMVRLADLQQKCVERLHKDWNRIHDRSVRVVDDLATMRSYDQATYYRLVDDDHHRRAAGYWKNHMCRSVPAAAFDWLEAFPEPPGDPVAHRYNRPPITQALHLYDAARRLGAEVPRWALPPDPR